MDGEQVMSDSDLLIFVSNMSETLAEICKERGMHSLLPSLNSTTAASRNLMKKLKLGQKAPTI